MKFTCLVFPISCSLTTVGYKSQLQSDPPIIFLPIIDFIFIISKLWFKCPVYQFYMIILYNCNLQQWYYYNHCSSFWLRVIFSRSRGIKAKLRRKIAKEISWFFVSILSFYRTDLTINVEILVHVHCNSTSICICFNKISCFFFFVCDASINRPVNNDVTYNNVLEWDEMGKDSVLRLSNR